MRCYFIRNGHVAGFSELADLSDQNAIEQSKLQFAAQPGAYDTFEVWQQARVVYLHTSPISNERTNTHWITL